MARGEAYQKAEQKIKEAQQSGAKRLDLRVYTENEKREKLTELPESIVQLTQLHSLNLDGNEMAELPESLGQLTQLNSLSLTGNQLTTLPESLGQLTQLNSLSLTDNQLTTLPESLGQLTQLQSLSLAFNQLTTLPVSLGQLTKLEDLDLTGNKLTTLPESLGNLTGLKVLRFSLNQVNSVPPFINRFQNLKVLWMFKTGLTELPNWIGTLKVLEELEIAGNQLDDLPAAVGELKNLQDLRLGSPGGGTQMRVLPVCIRQLTNLTALWLEGGLFESLPEWLIELKDLKKIELNHNPLNPDLAAAYIGGIEAVKSYLREMAKGARKRYEAKLFILGDGNEGKTCVSRALRSLPFRVQKTTHGVDVEQWKFPHPNDPANRSKEITLNIWDFEGQEISHQTHQFFLTSQSLYLLIFKCRDQFLIDRAEYWLDTIRARAPKAKVAIVITQCEERSPFVPQDRLQAQYGELFAKEWFFMVGCKTQLNIKKLQTFLQRWAADLEFMGSPWPASYSKAETRIKARAKKGIAHINRGKLNAIFAKAGVSQGGNDDAAAAMSRLGVITQFTDCPDLWDFVVLRPQWLTKAISKVMEDGKLSEDKGEITLKRMEALWNKAGFRGMFATFHNCMKEFELCYDLEDDSKSCLVPLRFGYMRPAIPWSNEQVIKERRVEYKLYIRPPMGIMSRFIVKTHHMIVKTEAYPKGIYWHNGVFLRSGEGPFYSEAFCEFVPEERKLRIEVRAAYPQNMSEQIHAYVKAVFLFFPSLEAERSYGCIKIDPKTEEEQWCSGFHTEKRIYSAISKQRILDCEFENHDVDPQKLIWGFSSFNDFVMAKVISLGQLKQELDRQPVWAEPFLRGVGALIDWVNVNGGKMDQLLQAQSAYAAEFKQEAELKLHEYLAYMSDMLDDREHTSAPGLISIMTKDRSPWNPVGYFKKTYVLTSFCECEGNIHACEDSKVKFAKNREWWEKSAPWVARGTKVLAVGLQLGFAGMPLALGAKAADAIKDQVKFMEELTKHLEFKAPEKDEATEAVQGDHTKNSHGVDREAALTRAALARLLEEIAPINYRARRWGSLRRIRMSDNSYRWLCEDCVKRAH